VGEWNSVEFSDENGELMSGTVDNSVVRMVSGWEEQCMIQW
jgi:hypothetical protein